MKPTSVDSEHSSEINKEALLYVGADLGFLIKGEWLQDGVECLCYVN